MGNVYETIEGLSQSTRRGLLDAEGHICGLFRNADEEYSVLIPFFKDGLERGERVHHVVDPSRKDEHIQRMTSAGIDMDAVRKSGQFVLREWSDIYFKGGDFDQDRVFAAFSDMFNESVRLGYPRTRCMGHMEWAVARNDLDELIEYEASYEQAVSQSPPSGDAVICVYQIGDWGGDLVMRTLRTHPLVIIGGALHENPFYAKPKEILSELKHRRASRSQCC